MVLVKSEEELEQAIGSGAQIINRIEAPTFYVTSMHLTFDPNDCTVTFQKAHPVLVSSGNDRIAAAALEPVVLVSMSPGAAKDLTLLLSDRIKQYEEEWGMIETEFTRSRIAKEATRRRRPPRSPKRKNG